MAVSDFPTQVEQPSLWCILPAAGVGARMQADCPKQYLKLYGKTILERTLEKLLSIPELKGIVVCVSPFDQLWPTLSVMRDPRIRVVEGGAERSQSVLNGLWSLEGELNNSSWVMVHDAARPCVRVSDVHHLMEQLGDHLVGGILGVKVSDTLKRVSDTFGIEATVDRSPLWQAQTPQMFRYGLLTSSLSRALKQELAVTDEASALELAGYAPIMVEGHRDNIKVTLPEDLMMAEMILKAQAAE